jgi:hypothetical protein
MWPGRFFAAAAGVLILLLAWSDLTRPLWGSYPFLSLSLPCGTMCFLAWTLSAIRRGPRPLPHTETCASLIQLQVIRVTVDPGDGSFHTAAAVAEQE